MIGRNAYVPSSTFKTQVGHFASWVSGSKQQEISGGFLAFIWIDHTKI